MLSVLIPSRNERFLTPTIKDLYAKASGDIEVIVHLDGPLNAKKGVTFDLTEDDFPNLHIIRRQFPVGMRTGINICAAQAKGKYLMKADAHCAFAAGFDQALMTECDDHWVVVPRRYSLDPDTWDRTSKSPKDYHYLSYPIVDGKFGGIHGKVWNKRRDERRNLPIDDEMTSQGSCWFMRRRHFWEFLGGMGVHGYGDFIQEFQEIGMKTWLGGGRVVINKRTWYAHLHKGKQWGRGYHVGRQSWQKGMSYSADLWINNKWSDRLWDMKWLVDKFMPIPTWPANYAEELGWQ